MRKITICKPYAFADCQKLFSSLDSNDLCWISNDVTVFNVLLEAICCNKLLKNASFEADLASLNMHPILMMLLTKEGWLQMNELLAFDGLS
jgi:hypothetical protein